LTVCHDTGDFEHIVRLDGPGGMATSAEQFLRARIWCESMVPLGAWCCDGTGRFWFRSMDDAVLFSLTWT
jgi:hypothetical protein